MDQASFSSTQFSSWLAGRLSNKTPLQRVTGGLREGRHSEGRKRGSFDGRNNANLACITLAGLFSAFASLAYFAVKESSIQKGFIEKKEVELVEMKKYETEKLYIS